MEIPIYHVDAFAEEVFEGNPAAVCPLKSWPEKDLLQKIAKENNLSETAFFLKNGDHYQLRWFTPESEVDLCGHATLATAFVIFENFAPEKNKVEFETESGRLEVRKDEEFLSMNFPSRPPEPCKRDEKIIEGLGTEPKTVLEARDFMAVYDSEEKIRALDPEMALLEKGDWTGIIATAEGKEFDFVSRFFAPNEGIPEDPVTGSAHCTLAPYWSEILGKKKLRARQLSARGGNVGCKLKGNRVEIKGKAVSFMKGKIKLGN